MENFSFRTKEEYDKHVGNFIDTEKFLRQQGDKMLKLLEDKHPLFNSKELVAKLAYGFLNIYYKEVHPDLLLVKINTIDGDVKGMYIVKEILDQFIVDVEHTRLRIRLKQNALNNRLKFYSIFGRVFSSKIKGIENGIYSSKMLLDESETYLDFLKNQSTYMVDVTDSTINILNNTMETPYLRYSKSFGFIEKKERF